MKALTLLSFLIFFCLPSILLASGKKGPGASISFHLQGSAAEAPKFARKVQTIAGEHYFRKTPEASTKDVVAFSSFPATDNRTYGLVFKLNPRAARRIETTTTANRGLLLLSLVNGQAVGVVKIDKPIKDGILVIWSGVSELEIKRYDQIFPRIGEDPKAWKKRLKKMKKHKK